MTGALLGTGLRPATTYRPAPRLAALVRARDGRCRFPGCSVAARFCDLDHVRPWPVGPTAPANLLTLCRRHHRIKQRPGWSVRLTADGRAAWRDPTGRVRTTAPRDLLAPVVLPAPPAENLLPEGPRAAASAIEVSGTRHCLYSPLEVVLEVLGDGASSAPVGGWTRTRGTRCSADPTTAAENALRGEDAVRRAVAGPGEDARGGDAVRGEEGARWHGRVRVAPADPRGLRYVAAQAGHAAKASRALRRRGDLARSTAYRSLGENGDSGHDDVPPI